MITLDQMKAIMTKLSEPAEYKPLLYFAPDGKIYDAGRNYTLIDVRQSIPSLEK